MNVAFTPFDDTSAEAVLDYMRGLYAAGGYDRERQRAGLADLADHPELGAAWLIEVDGRPAGYLVMTIGFSLEFHGRFGLLDELFVDPAWRDHGIGSRALEFAGEWARGRGLRFLRLEVGHQNPGALRLYRRSGFSAPDRHFLSKAL